MGPADGITPGPNREAYTFRLTLIGILRAAQAKRPRTKWATKIQETTSPSAEGGGRQAACNGEISLLFPRRGKYRDSALTGLCRG